VDLDALAVAIDTARSTGDHGVLYDELAVQGWRRPSRKQPSTEEIAANVTVDPVTGCWLWRGRIDGHGYGLWRGQAAHRLSCRAFVGPIPSDTTSTISACLPQRRAVVTVEACALRRLPRCLASRGASQRPYAWPLHAPSLERACREEVRTPRADEERSVANERRAGSCAVAEPHRTTTLLKTWDPRPSRESTGSHDYMARRQMIIPAKLGHSSSHRG
jgi:hypothetical protein